MSRKPEDILADMDEIMSGAETDGLTDEQCTRYEALETELSGSRKVEEVQRRHAALKAPAPGQLMTGAKPKEDDTLERAFVHYLRTGQENQDIAELRAQSKGTDTAGGYTVPDGFRNKLTERRKAFGGLANIVESITTATGQSLEWPTMDDTANSAAIVAENAAPAAGGADLVFGSKTLGAYKYVATGAGNVPLKVSRELLQDSAIDIEALVARKLGERIARKQAPDLVNGTGSGQPLGIVTGLTPIELGTSLSYANLLSVVHSVDPAYRQNASWAFNDATLAKVRAVVDGNGRPLLVDASRGIEGGPGGTTLLGYPVTVDQAFATYDPADDDLNMGVFGDLREGYVVRHVQDVVVFVDPYSFAINGQVAFHAWARMDATQQNTNAYVAFSGAEA